MNSKWISTMALSLAILLLAGCGQQRGATEQGAGQDAASDEVMEEVILDTEIDEKESCPHDTMAYRELSAPTCTAEGSATYVCSLCGTALSDEVALPALGHSYVYASDDSGHWQVCSVCGERTETKTHDNSNGICKICGYGCSHNFLDKVVAPTCTDRGYTTHTCEKCGYTTVDSYTNALGHTYTGKVVKAATCLMEGDGEFNCTRCGEKYRVSIPALGHHVVVDPLVEATCQSTGLTQGLHCDTCGAVLEPQETVPATDHVYLEGKCIWCGEAAPEEYTYIPGENELPEIPL